MTFDSRMQDISRYFLTKSDSVIEDRLQTEFEKQNCNNLNDIQARVQSVREQFFGNGVSGLICRLWGWLSGFTRRLNYLERCMVSVGQADPSALTWFITVKKNNRGFNYNKLNQIYLHGQNNHLSVIDNLAQMGTPNDVLKKQIEAFISKQKADGISTPKISWKDAPNLLRREVDNYASLEHPLSKIHESVDLQVEETRFALSLYNQQKNGQLFSEVSEADRSENVTLDYDTNRVSIGQMIIDCSNNKELLQERVKKIMEEMCLEDGTKKVSNRHAKLLNLLFGSDLDHPTISFSHIRACTDKLIFPIHTIQNLVRLTKSRKYITKTKKGFFLERRYKFVLSFQGKDQAQVSIPFVTRNITQKINAYFPDNNPTPKFDFRVTETIDRHDESDPSLVGDIDLLT